MTQDNTNTTFMSCIKIKGIHLLPPLITEKRRVELQQYKQQAIKLERHLRNCRELKKNLQELLNFQPLIADSHLQSEITFRDNTHVEALGITEKIIDITLSEDQKERKPHSVHLTKDIIDVTEYSDSGIKMIQSSPYENVEPEQGQLNTVETSVNKSLNTRLLSQPKICNEHFINDKRNSEVIIPSSIVEKKLLKKTNNNSVVNDPLKNISPDKSPRPRLIRSNSYTLDSPSPILLAHLERTGKNGDHKNFEQVQQLLQSRNWSSLEDNYIPFETSNFSSINTVYNNADNFSNEKDITCSTPTPKTDKADCEKSVSPVIEVIQTDISVQHITVNTNDTLNDAPSKNICDTSDNTQLMQILQNIPEKYSKQIIEIIKKQELEELKTMDSNKIVYHCLSLDDSLKEDQSYTQLIDNCATEKTRNENITERNDVCKNIEFETQSHVSLSASSNILPKKECQQDNIHQSISLSDSTTSISPSQSIHYSVTSSDTFQTLSSPSIKLIDLECEFDKTLNEKCVSKDADVHRDKDILEYFVQEQINKNMNLSRELFPQIDAISVQTIREEWAASIIGAHVKGYLTRRLLKTERVQTLIDTIKDALICALQLHNAENIDESDVELHRRLINQVSAACYAFHDIFFSLSVQEQMSIISTDRQRKIEKARRPASAPGSRRSTLTSSRSSSKQRLQTHSQSLTKV